MSLVSVEPQQAPVVGTCGVIGGTGCLQPVIVDSKYLRPAFKTVDLDLVLITTD